MGFLQNRILKFYVQLVIFVVKTWTFRGTVGLPPPPSLKLKPRRGDPPTPGLYSCVLLHQQPKRLASYTSIVVIMVIVASWSWNRRRRTEATVNVGADRTNEQRVIYRLNMQISGRIEQKTAASLPASVEPFGNNTVHRTHDTSAFFTARKINWCAREIEHPIDHMKTTTDRQTDIRTVWHTSSSMHQVVSLIHFTNRSFQRGLSWSTTHSCNRP